MGRQHQWRDNKKAYYAQFNKEGHNPDSGKSSGTLTLISSVSKRIAEQEAHRLDLSKKEWKWIPVTDDRSGRFREQVRGQRNLVDRVIGYFHSTELEYLRSGGQAVAEHQVGECEYEFQVDLERDIEYRRRDAEMQEMIAKMRKHGMTLRMDNLHWIQRRYGFNRDARFSEQRYAANAMVQGDQAAMLEYMSHQRMRLAGFTLNDLGEWIPPEGFTDTMVLAYLDAEGRPDGMSLKELARGNWGMDTETVNPCREVPLDEPWKIMGIVPKVKEPITLTYEMDFETIEQRLMAIWESEGGAVGKKWDEDVVTDPIADLESWRDEVANRAGKRPTHMRVNGETYGLDNVKGIYNLMHGYGFTPYGTKTGRFSNKKKEVEAE